MNARKRDKKGRFLPKKNPKKISIRVTEEERKALQVVRLSNKITIIGLHKTGKTVLIHRYVRHDFISDYIPTIGMNAEGIQIGDIEVSIWDLGGQLQFRRALWEMYSKNSKGIIFLIDVNAPEDFPEVRKTLSTILSYKHLEHIPIAIFLNKIDLVSKKRSILLENLNLTLLLQDRIHQTFFTSVKTNYKVKSGFKWIISQVILQSGLKIPKKFEPRIKIFPAIAKTPDLVQIPKAIYRTTKAQLIPSQMKIRKTSKKIIFSSLAYAGQATICRRIRNPEWIPSKDDQYHATIDYERYQKVIHRTEFTLFNLGGQTTFLDRFTGELAEFIFSGVVAYIFTVDSIDIKVISLAKYYFDLSLKKIEQYSPKSSVYLFIHKQDLLPESMKDEVNQTLQEIMLKDIKRIVRVFHTSIYNNSIFRAMDTVFREHIQIYEKERLFDDTSSKEEEEMLSQSLRNAIKFVQDENYEARAQEYEARAQLSRNSAKVLRTEDEGDDVLSLSLRTALKILREKD